MVHRFDTDLWRYQGDAAWFFVTVPQDVSDDIRESVVGPRRGFGSVRVRATVGGTVWSTSVFPQSKEGTFVLPVKKAVRQAEGVDEGDLISVTLEVLDPTA